MKTEPLRSIVSAYGLAALAALAAMGFGVTPWIALPAAWIGGAFATLAIAAATLPLRRPDAVALAGDDLSAEAAAWDEDRDRDKAAAAAAGIRRQA
jgi:hypothetical protein